MVSYIRYQISYDSVWWWKSVEQNSLVLFFHLYQLPTTIQYCTVLQLCWMKIVLFYFPSLSTTYYNTILYGSATVLNKNSVVLFSCLSPWDDQKKGQLKQLIIQLQLWQQQKQKQRSNYIHCRTGKENRWQWWLNCVEAKHTTTLERLTNFCCHYQQHQKKQKSKTREIWLIKMELNTNRSMIH